MELPFQPAVNFDNSFKIRLGHKELPFTDLELIEQIIFSSYNTDVKRFMGFVEENCHIHIFLEFRDKVCDRKTCENMRKVFYKEIKYLENVGQGGQNPISITPYKKYRKQEYKILSEVIQLYHQVCYITKDAIIHDCVIRTKHIKYNITTKEIKVCREYYYNNYRKIIQYFEKLKVNKKIKNKTNKQQFIDYVDSKKFLMFDNSGGGTNLGWASIPSIVANYYTDYPQEHTIHNVKMKTYYILSKMFPDYYKQLICQTIRQELIKLSEK